MNICLYIHFFVDVKNFIYMLLVVVQESWAHASGLRSELEQSSQLNTELLMQLDSSRQVQIATEWRMLRLGHLGRLRACLLLVSAHRCNALRQWVTQVWISTTRAQRSKLAHLNGQCIALQREISRLSLSSAFHSW